jgi:hypothetical protein
MPFAPDQCGARKDRSEGWRRSTSIASAIAVGFPECRDRLTADMLWMPTGLPVLSSMKLTRQPHQHWDPVAHLEMVLPLLPTTCSGGGRRPSPAHGHEINAAAGDDEGSQKPLARR